MQVFRKRNGPEAVNWHVEVDYGDGWIAYGPPLADRRSAEIFAFDLTRCGHGTRVAPAKGAAAGDDEDV